MVTSYDGSTRKLCLEGDAVADLAGADGHKLCGVWRRTEDAARPEKGDTFRFVSSINEGQQSGPDDDVVTIFGEVAD